MIFKIYPKYSISLKERNIHDFKYFDIMHNGSYPYGITYAIQCALTNSINNKMIANKEFIEINKLFNKVRKYSLLRFYEKLIYQKNER